VVRLSSVRWHLILVDAMRSRSSWLRAPREWVRQDIRAVVHHRCRDDHLNLILAQVRQRSRHEDGVTAASS